MKSLLRKLRTFEKAFKEYQKDVKDLWISDIRGGVFEDENLISTQAKDRQSDDRVV